MAKKCEVKPYINKLSITDDHKKYINNLHNSIYDELLSTKAFTVKDGNLYALKQDYVKSQKAINQINLKYGNVATLLNDKYQGRRLVNINAISLGTGFTIQQATREAEKLLRQDAERLGVPYNERYMFDDVNPSSEDFQIISNAFYIPNVDYYFIQGLTNSIFGDIMSGISDPNNKLGHDQIIKLNLLNYFNEFKNRFKKIQEDSKKISSENVDDYIQSGENSNTIHIFANWKQVEAIVFSKLNKINQSENKSQIELDYDNSLEEGEETVLENEVPEDLTEDTSSDIEIHNEDRADLLNPKDKISIKEKIFLSSIPTGRKVIAGISNEYESPLFNEYYSLDNILPQLINLLSLSVDNYYELSYESVRDIIDKSNYKWKDAFLEKLDKADKEFQTEFISSKYTVKANYEQVLVDDNVIKVLSTNNNSAISLLKSELINTFPEEYTTVDENGIVNLQPAFLLALQNITNKNILISDATNVKSNFLNFLSLMNFDKLLNISIQDFPEEFFTTRNVKIRYVENGVNQTGYLSLAEYFNRYKINYFNNINKNLSENTFTTSLLYDDNIVNVILSHVVKLKNYADPIMNKDGNKSTSNFTTPRRFYNRVIEFINNPDYFKTHYSQSGDWLKNLDLLNYFTLALQPHRDTSKKRFQNPDISKYNDPDHEHIKAMFFFGNNEGSKGLKFAKYFANTYSDKKKITGISYIRREFGTLLFDDNLSDIVNDPTPNQENLINLLYSQLVEPDINRIVNEDLSGILSTYNKNIFYNIPTITISDVGMQLQQLLFNNTTDVTKEEIQAFFDNPDNKQALKLTMLEYLKQEVVNTQAYWDNINFGVVPILDKPGKFEPSNLSQSVYNEYSKKFSGLNGSDLQFVLASDYVLNYAIHYANMNMFIAGDPAQFAKGKIDLTQVISTTNAKTNFINNFKKFYNGVTTNITKRLAKLSSPSRLTKYKYDQIRYLVVSDNESRAIGIRYIVDALDKEHIQNNLSNFITKRNLPLDTTADALIVDVIKDFDDFVANGLSTSEIEEFLKEYFPSSAAYFNVTHADAQEFVHWEHHLDYLLGLGKINEADYKRLYDAIESNTQLTSSDLKTLFSGIKPLYSGEMKVNNSMIEYYIKSSHIPLIPSIVKGKPIEEVYNIMNQRVSINDTQTRPFIDRLTFKSAVKVGLPKSIPTLYTMSGDEGATINKNLNITEENILKLSSKYLGDQVEVPVKSKNKVTDATQFKKLLSSNIQNEPIELKNESLKTLMNDSITTVKNLIQKRNNLYRDLYLMDRDKLIKRIIVNGKLNYAELFNVLKEEMAARNYSPNERAFIDLIGEGNEETFVLPLYLTTNPKKYDALIASLIDKAGVTSTKRNGYAFVQASDLGFSGGKMTSKLSEYQGITYTSEYKKNKRTTLEYISYEGDNVMEIIIPWRFKESIDLFLDEDGNIDSTKLPAELLRGIGYRIPNQAHSSMRAFKIVGFLPEKYGNVAIVPSAVTKQMGSDFDIDKLYSYLPSFEVNLSDEEIKTILQEPAGYGKLINSIKYQPKRDKRSVLENSIFDIEYEILSSTNQFIQKAQLQPLDNSMSELKNIVNLINSNIKYNSNEEEQLKSIILPSYQREKFISGTSGKSGVGWFSLLLTFNALVQNQDISINNENYIPLNIQIFDQGERLVSKQNALPSISYQFDINTLNELKAYYNRIDAEGKQLVYDKEIDEYKLLDFKNIKDIEAVTSEFSDRLGIDTIVVPQDEMDRIIQADPTLYNTITDITDKVLLAYNGDGLIVSEDSTPKDSLKFYTSEIISDLEVLSTTSPEAKEVLDNLFNSAVTYLQIREDENFIPSDDVAPFSLEEVNKTQVITDAIVDLIETKNVRKGSKGFYQALSEFIDYIKSILHTKLAEKLITNRVITASDLTAKSDIGKLISLNDLANIIAVSDNKINSKERLKTQIEYKLTEDELANLNNLRSNYSVAKELIKEQVKETSLNTPINIFYTLNDKYSQLSNFANRPFKIGGVSYQNVESAYQHIKISFADPITEQPLEIQNANWSNLIGYQAKQLGKKIKGLNKEEWDNQSSQIMKTLIKTSFEQNPKDLELLLSTGNSKLVHNNPKSGKVDKWTTEFPRILTEVRDELRSTLPVQQSSNLSINIPVEKLTEDFSRTSVQNDPDYIYLFTDNANRTSGSNLVDPNSWYAQKYGITSKYPTKTQAVIRGLNNAFPITTMIDQNKTQWSDDNFDEYVKLIDSEINDIKDALNTNKYKGIKYSGTFGDGTYSKIKDNAPKIWEYLNNKLLEVGINNNFKPIESSKDSTQAIRDLFDNDIKLANSVYEALGFKTIPVNISEIKDFEGTIIEYVDHIGLHENGRNIGARNINKGEKIQVVLAEMQKKFEEKAWTNPVNSEPLSQDEFSSFEELMIFMYLHEKAHEYILQEEGESLKQYETRVNNEALRRLNSEFKITPEQKEQAVQSYNEYLNTVFPNEQQTHILGSNQDIEGFKKFITKDEQPDEIPAGTPVIINGIPTVVPENSNPTNTVIFEKDGVRYLMNDGQEKAYQSIKSQIQSKLAINPKVSALSDFSDHVVFTDPLAKKYSNIIPQMYYNNSIGLLGRGGVGKTTIIKKIIEDVIKDNNKTKNKYAQNLAVHYVTPTHNAATELQLALEIDSETTKGSVSTIQSLTGRLPKPENSKYKLHYPDIDQKEDFPLISKEQYFTQLSFGKRSISSYDIIVFDESSMLSEAGLKGLYKRLEEEYQEIGVRKIPIMIFMGDYRQLGPVNEKQNEKLNKGLISSTLFTDSNKTEELTQVMRSQNKALHEIFDTIGSQIVENMNSYKNNGKNVDYSFDSYDKLTNKSTDNVLVVKDVDGVIDDYTDYLSTNDNPNGMFWVHYNNISHTDTKDLFKKIRQSYFKKLVAANIIDKDIDVNNVKHRTFYKGDYIEYTGGMEVKTNSYKIPKVSFVESHYSKYASKLKVSDDNFLINNGVIKPNARFKILDIFEKETDLASVNSTLSNIFSIYNYPAKTETVLLYNRQDKLRAITYLKSLYVEIGNYNSNTKTIELTLVNSENNTVVKKVNVPYSTYKNNEQTIISYSKNRGIKTSFSPSYIGSSHTVQGSSIKNIIVGEYNIKANLARNVNQDDIMSSLYVGLTRTSGTLTLIKESKATITDNQEDFKGFIYDDNNKLEDETNIRLEDEGLNPASLTDEQNSLVYNKDSIKNLEKRIVDANNSIATIRNQQFNNRYNLISDFSTQEKFLKNFSETYIKRFDPTFNVPLVNKSYHIVGYQSASVDNANEAILDDGHLNDETFKFAKPALMYGFDKLAIQSVLQLPILKEYFKELSYSKSLGSSYQADLDSIILRKLANKYLSNDGNPITDSAYETIIANLMKLKASNPKEFYNWNINPANNNTPAAKQEQYKILLGYFDFVERNKILDNYMGLLNTDSKGGGGSILSILDRLTSITNIIQSNNNPFTNIESLFYTAISASNIDNLNYVFNLFNDPNISLAFRKDLLFQKLLNEYSEKFELSQDDYKFKQSTLIFETAIKSVLYNKALQNVQNTTPHSKRLRLLISGSLVIGGETVSNKSLGDIINIIKRHDYLKLNLDPNSTRFKQLQALSNSKFFTQLKVEESREYVPRKGNEFKNNKLHLIKYNQNISKNDLDDSNSVDIELLNIYNDNFEIANGYTTVNLINDLLDYSIVTGAENSPTTFFNKIPAALIIMRYGEALRNLSSIETPDTKSENKYELSLLLQEILFNNTELLPSASKNNLTVDKSGSFLTVKKDKVKITPLLAFNDTIWIKDATIPFRYNKTQKLNIGKSLKQYGDISTTSKNILNQSVPFVYITPENMVPSGEAVLTNKVDSTEQTPFIRAISDVSNLKLPFNSFGFLEQIKLQIANNNSENTYALADIVNSFMSTSANIPVIFANLPPNQLGKYDTLKDIIILNNTLRSSENRNKLFNTFLHELGHVATWRKLLQYQQTTGKSLGIKVDSSNLDFYTELSKDDQVIIEKLFDSYNTIKTDLPYLVNKYNYVFKNVGEFIAEFIGNPAFRTELNIESSSNKSLRQKVRDIYNSIVDLLKSFLFGTTSLDEVENPVMTSILESILYLSKTTTSVRLLNDSSKKYDVELIDNNIYTAKIKLNGSELINPIEKVLDIKNNSDQYVVENIETTTGIDLLPSSAVDIDPSLEETDNSTLENDDDTAEDVSEKAYKDYVLPLTKGELLTSNSKYKRLIELINNRLKKLYEQKAKQITIQKNPSSSLDQIHQALNNLDRINAELNSVSLDLQKAMESEDIFQILDVTKRQFNYIDKILNNPNFKPSAEQLIYVSDLIDNYKIFFDRSNKDSFINVEDYEFLSDETKELYNNAINNYRTKLEASYVHNLDRKLKNYVLDIVEQYTGKREWNYEEVLPDITMIAKYTLSVDRTNEDILGVYSRIKAEDNVEIRENIAKKLLKLDDLAKKALPYLTRLMKPNSKFGIHEPFINDDGTFVLDLTQSFMDERRQKEKEWREANEQYKLNLITQKKYEKAKKDWRDYIRNIYVSLDPRVYFEGYTPLYSSIKSQAQKDALRNRDLAKLGQATLDYELEKMKTHVENFERDYAAYKLHLNEKYSNEDGTISPENKKIVDELTQEFIYSNHPVHIYEFFNEFDSTSKLNLSYSNKNFNYTTNTVKRTSWETGKDTGYYNPKMDIIRNNPDLLNYYNEIKEIFRFGRSILPEYMQENLRLSDIPFMEKELLVGNIKQLVTERKSFMSKLWTKVVSTLIEKRPEQIDDIPDDQVSTSFIRKNAVDVNDLLEKRLVEYYLKLDITPDQIVNYKKEYVLLKKNPQMDLNKYSYYRVRNQLRKEIIAEQNEYKSFDLLKVAKNYYSGAMNYHQKFNTVDNLALVKELGEKKFNDPDKNELKEAGIKILNKNTTAPNKADILDKDFRFYRGYSNRTPQNPLQNLKKKYNVLEKFIKEKTENALKAVEEKLATYTDIENLNEADKAAYESLLALKNQYLDDIDKLGGYIYFSNVVRAYNKLLAFVQLGFNVGSFIPNMLYGTFNNAYEVADGRVINQESYSKVFREMYYRSDKTKMAALAIGAVAGNIIMPFYGTFIGGALAYQLGKLAPKSSISEKIFKFMDSRDVYQKIQDEINKETTKSGAETSLIDKAFIFTSESEALHQGTLAGSILENTKVKLDNGDVKSLLELMDSNGNVPDIKVENPKIEGQFIQLPQLLNEATVAIVSYISRTHGNYRNDFRQMYKDNDYLATLGTFRGWLWESYATRYESESTDWLIGSQKNTTQVKGSYRSVMENSGIWGVLAGLGGSSMTKSIIISAITGSPWGMLIGAGISTAGLGYTLHKADLLKDALNQGKSDINKNFLKSIINKSLQVPFRSKRIEWFKGAEDSLANNLSEVDAANYRKVITELTFGIWLFGIYSTLLIAKSMGSDDDDEDNEITKRLQNYALNTTGRLMLDLNAYSSSSDFYSKVSTIEKMIPVVNMANTHYKLISNLMTLAEYERKTGMFEKGELKYKKYLLETLPVIRPIYNQYRYNEQEFSLFKEANK